MPRRRNRDLYQIYYSILDIAREPRNTSIIVKREFTSYQHVKVSLLSLIEYGLIEQTDGKYHTTAKGLRFLTVLDKIHQMLPWLKIDLDLDFKNFG